MIMLPKTKEPVREQANSAALNRQWSKLNQEDRHTQENLSLTPSEMSKKIPIRRHYFLISCYITAISAHFPNSGRTTLRAMARYIFFMQWALHRRAKSPATFFRPRWWKPRKPQFFELPKDRLHYHLMRVHYTGHPNQDKRVNTSGVWT
jgi:hypothetical protein